MSLTKAQIDALVANMVHRHTDGRPDDITALGSGPARDEVRRVNLTSALYLAAGLTAEGERKPERVRCWLYTTCNGKIAGLSTRPETIDPSDTVTPGWFVPDGAE